MSGYFCVSGECERTEIIERSKFICYLKGIENEEEAKAFISEIKKKHSLATHNCYAYIADEKGLVQKFSDDGEPQGTAGMPMLSVLKNRKIYKTVAVVTRYFGGIKLGTGGLSRAYGGAVSECLKEAEISDMQSADLYSVTTDYEGYTKLLKAKLPEGIKACGTVFDEKTTTDYIVKNENDSLAADFISKVSEILKGKADITKKSSGYYRF